MHRYSVLIHCIVILCIFNPYANAASIVQRGVSSRNTNTINNDTTVRSASENIITDKQCTELYNACMDTFCMSENESGGRCICNNKIFELDKKLSQIEKTDLQAYQLSTTDINAIETSGVRHEQKKRQRLDMSMWQYDSNDDTDADKNNQRGAKLFTQSHTICAEKISECEPEIAMLQTLYNQKTKSDCAAYENSLKQKQIASNEKMAQTTRAMRTAAYQQLQNTNKYSLGECAIQFTKCMQTTAECGDDFSKCINIPTITSNNSRNVKSRTAHTKYTIAGIDIAAETYEQLISKKPICDSVTKQCETVAPQVWDTFLQANATAIKNAELIAENRIRTNCISNISECFQSACHDNIDPHDPDGSYNLCLSRPGTMLNLCKTQLDACGVATTSEIDAALSPIWDFVVSRLASMRVDACTAQVKECLKSDNMCGADYSRCVGLDTDTIIRMCPYDKLDGCQKLYGSDKIRDDAIYEELSTMVTGLMVDIDNEMLTYCQNAVTNAMLSTCNSTHDCNSIITNPSTGTHSLEYKICEYVTTDDIGGYEINYNNCRATVDNISDVELGRVYGSTSGELGPVVPFVGVMDGMIYWEKVSVGKNGMPITSNEYFKMVETSKTTEEQQLRIRNELDKLLHDINSVISAIESDPTVQYCMTGRNISGAKPWTKTRQTPRFPELTKATRMQITNAALKVAKDNYYKKYDEYNTQMLRDYTLIAERQAEIRGDNSKDIRRETARQSCVALAQMSTMPKSPDPPKNPVGMIIIGVVLATAITLLTVFTAGAGTFAAGAGVAAGKAAAATTGLSTMASATTVTTSTASGMAALTSVPTLTFGGLATGSSAAAGVVGTAVSTAVTGSLASSAAIAATAGTIAAATIGATAGYLAAPGANPANMAAQLPTTGYYEMNQWNFKEHVLTEFNIDTLNCQKCTITTNCEKTKNPIFGNKSCSKWSKEVKTCTDIQF